MVNPVVMHRDSISVEKTVRSIMKENPFISLKSLAKETNHSNFFIGHFYMKVRRSEEWTEWVKLYRGKYNDTDGNTIEEIITPVSGEETVKN